MEDQDARSFRRSPRARVRLRVRLRDDVAGEPRVRWATTGDLGPGGAFLCCEERYAPGTTLQLTIDAGGSEPPETVQAEVRWRTPSGADRPGVGVAFLERPAGLYGRYEEIEAGSDLPVMEISE